MKIKVSLLIILALVLLSRQAEAIPEASAMLADLYCTYQPSESSFGANLASFIAGSKSSRKFTAGLEKEISDIKSRKPFTQAEAVSDIKAMVKSEKLPAYIIEKGKYKYTSGINAVYPSENVRLRSQPNTSAKIITTIKAGYKQGRKYTPPEISDYLGEWTSPKSEKWVLVNYRPSLTSNADEKKLGWIHGDYAKFVTDDDIMNTVDVCEHPGKYLRAGNIEEISPETLLRAYVGNPFKAEKQYKGKIVRLHGEITAIKADDGIPTVEFDVYFSDLNQRAVAVCFVPREDPLLAEIETGKNITIQGYVENIDTEAWNKAFRITDCKIISAN